MPDGRKISQFPAAVGINNADVVSGVQNGVSTKFSFATIFLWLKSVLIPSDIGAIPTTAKGVANGVASLDGNGQVPSSQLDLSGKQDTITASGILKGNGAGGVSAAVAGTDYGTYSKPSGGIPASDLANGVIPTVPSAYTSNPAMDGTASPGSSGEWAKGDHVHPSDTTKANQAQLATVESGSTASRAYNVGEYFCLNGLLYRVTAVISSGASFTPGTNCELTVIGDILFQNKLPDSKYVSLGPGKKLVISASAEFRYTAIITVVSNLGALNLDGFYLFKYFDSRAAFHSLTLFGTAASNLVTSSDVGTSTIENTHTSGTAHIFINTLGSSSPNGELVFTIV